MSQLLLSGLIAVFAMVNSCTINQSSKPIAGACDCDTIQTKKIVTSGNFNRIPEYDSSNFAKLDFYKLDSSINRNLWYRDIENIDTTKFTNLWDAYFPANYHASHLDFIKYYKERKNIELAFQFGPNQDLWAYHIFVIKKINCCYLVTRSYFRHARFNYKAYAIIDGKQLDSLYSVIGSIHTEQIGTKEDFKYCGYFVDNRNGKTFYIDFENQPEIEKPGNNRQPKKEIKDLYDFVDKHIKWTETYIL